MINDRINIILITGFLGSGKTTLLNRLIDKYKSVKLGLIINDFGKISVDGILLKSILDKQNKSKDNSIYEIKNGSIFCSCLSAELVVALKKYIEIKPDILIIETSGLSDPSVFQKILEENQISSYFNLLSAVCLIDPNNVLKLFNRITAIEKQIISSDIHIINKVDMVDRDLVEEVKGLIRGLKPSCNILETTFSQIDLKLLEQENKSFVDTKNPVSCNTVNNRPGNIILRSGNISIESLQQFYKSISDKILRLKGFIKIDGKIYYVSSNNSVLNIDEYSDKPQGGRGLSVLLANENVDFVFNEWDKIINADKSASISEVNE